MPSSHEAPPAALDRPLEVGPDDWRAPGFYQLLTALVVPRPVGWIFHNFGERSAQRRTLFILQPDGERPTLCLVSRRTRNSVLTREQFRALLSKIKSEI